jgi:hypothetical protein
MKPGPGRRAFFTIATACFVIVLVELLSYVGIAIVERKATSLGTLNQRMDEMVRTGPWTRLDREVRYRAEYGEEVVHPYLGFVGAPTEELGVRGLGFGEREPLLRRRSPDMLLVGITGGSVADQFTWVADEMLAALLAESPLLAGRKVAILRLAKGGWKQPQQLMALNYLLALGGELDVLINLDGFNEVALHAVENQPRGVFPAFPRNWYMRARSLPDPVVLPVVGRIAYLEVERKRWARELRRPPLRWSAAAGFVWLTRDRMLDAEIAQAQGVLLEHVPEERDYTWTGPQVEFESEEALYEELVSIWGRSSLQMHRLSQANGILYLHFLQPNQYVEDSKPMGPDERRVAYREDMLYRAGAVRGYPLLIRECRRFAANDVPCHDLTQLYADVEEPIYNDSCCHVGRRGNEILGAAIAEILLQELEAAGDIRLGGP